MTACVNKTEMKEKGGVFQSKVLRSAMAGVLAIGLMPAIPTTAFAANVLQPKADGVTISPNDAWDGQAYDNSDHAMTTSVAIDGSPQAGDYIQVSIETPGSEARSETMTFAGMDDVSGEDTNGDGFVYQNNTWYAEAGFTAHDAGEYVASCGAESETYRVNPLDLVGADVKITLKDGVSFVYNAAQHELDADDVESVVANGVTLDADDYALNGYANNIDAGQATVNVAGVVPNTQNTALNVPAFDIVKATASDVDVAWNAGKGTNVQGNDPTALAQNDVSVTIDGNTVISGGNVTVNWASTDKKPTADTPAGTIEDAVVVTWPGDNNIAAGSTTLDWTVSAQPLSGTLTLAGTTDLAYTGADLSEGITATLGSLVQGTDFALSYMKRGEDGTWAAVDGIVDAGTYKAVATGMGNYSGTVYSEFTVSAATNIKAEWDGEEIGWTGGDQTELASSHIVATFEKADGVYTLVQGTEAEVKGGKADYWVTWNEKVIGSDEHNTEYTATLHFGGNFGGTDTVTMTVYETNPQTIAQEFAEGEITRALDNAGNLIEAPYEFTYDGAPHYVVPKELTTNKGVVLDLTEYNGSTPAYDVAYKDAAGNAVVPTNAGDYKAIVTCVNSESPYFGCTFEQEFTINPASLEGAEASDDCTPAFVWNGQDHVDGITFELNGKELAQDDEYTLIGWYKADGKTAVSGLTEAGDYVAKLVGVGNYEGSVEVAITIAPLDLSTAALSINDMVEKTHPAEDYDLADIDVFASYIDAQGQLQPIELKGGVTLNITSGQKLAADRGAYTVSVAPAKDNANLTGTGNASFAIVGELVDDFQYKGTPFEDVANVVFNIDRGEALDPADIAVYDSASNKLDSAEWELEVTDLEGNAAPNYAEAPGDYIATVTVGYGEDYAMGGKASFAFKVVAGAFAESDIFVSFDGVTIDEAPEGLYWNGEDQSGRFTVMVKKDGTQLAEGTDYEWYFTKAGTDERVDELVAAGSYDLHVDGLAWVGNWAPVENVTIEQLPVLIGATGMKTFDQRGTLPIEGYAYTGSAIDVAFGWESLVGGYYANAEGALDAADYTLVNYQKFDVESGKWVDVDEVVDAGNYRAIIELTASGEAKFAYYNTEVYFQVIDKVAPFEDVTADQWYAERVAEAYAAWYINGYAGTDFFGPDNSIKRGDVACILFNVAVNGGVADLDHWMNASATTSAFADVAAGDYWTAAINWAAAAKVVNGYEGTDLFDPEANITREAFASMLANYAKATKDYVAPTTDISGMPGADGVSGWALENVQWAVENGIMGNNGADLNAQGTITRAEVAAMVMNFTEKF